MADAHAKMSRARGASMLRHYRSMSEIGKSNWLRVRSERWLRSLLGVRGETRSVVLRENGRELRLDVPDDALWSGVLFVALLRAYEHAGLEWDGRVGLVVDAGAHAGLFALRASVHADRVVAIEPHPTLVALLRNNVTRSGATNVEVVDKALSDGAGNVTLRPGGDSVSASVTGEENAPGTRVAAIGLDVLLAAYDSVDLLKLNVEGAEFAIIAAAADATLRKIRNIAAELHTAGREHDVAPLIQRLRGAGFEVVVRDPPSYSWHASAGRVIANWRSVHGETRTKIVACAIFTMLAVVRPLIDLRPRLDTDGLRYLHASRPAVSSQSAG